MAVEMDLGTGTEDSVTDEAGAVVEQNHVMQTSEFWSGKGQPCMVGFGAGLTVPTQPYANARPQVSLQLPADFEQIEEAYDYAMGWVDERLAKIRKGIEEGISHG